MPNKNTIWNFRHIVNVKTINRVRAITSLVGYKPIEIWQPSVLLKEDEEKIIIVFQSLF